MQRIQFEKFLLRIKNMPQYWLVQGAFTLFLVLGLYQAACLTWTLLTYHSSWTDDQVVFQVDQHQPQTSDLKQVKDLYLFGEPEAEEETIPAANVLSALNLKVTGILLSTDSGASVAVISSELGQNSYRVSDWIEGTQIQVIGIFSDRVIILHDRRQEILMLEGIEDDIASRSVSRKPSAKPAVKLPMDDIVKDPMRILDFVNIMPKDDHGQLVGYALSPGKNPAWFYENGLADGDIAVALNGVDLTDEEKMLSVMQQLPSMSQVNVTLNRGGQFTDVTIDLN